MLIPLDYFHSWRLPAPSRLGPEGFFKKSNLYGIFHENYSRVQVSMRGPFCKTVLPPGVSFLFIYLNFSSLDWLCLPPFFVASEVTILA